MFNISFLNAGILIAAISAILPLLIHLFSKQKPKTVYFSSLKFIKESLKERNKSIKINNILIIIIRTLIILLTILAISRPALKIPLLKQHQTRSETAIAIILDNSYSMEYLVDNETELEKAKKIIKEINKLLNDKDITILMTRDEQWNKLNANLTYGKIKENNLENIKYTLNHKSLEELIQEASIKLQESHFLNKEIYVVTDYQQEPLPKKSDIPVFIIPSSDNRSQGNLACTSNRIESDYLKSPFEKTVLFDVHNYSSDNQNDIVTKIILNSSVVSEKMISVPAKQNRTESFKLSNCKAGWNTGYVEIKNERMEVDNKSYFSFYIEENKRVGIFSDNTLDKSFDTMLDIFLVNNGKKEYLKAESFASSQIPDYSFFIIKQSTYSPQLKLLVDKFQENNKTALFILNKGLNTDDKKWLESLFNIQFNDNSKNDKNQNITFTNKFHILSKVFAEKQLLNQTVSPMYNISLNSSSNPLIQTSSGVIALENANCLWNIDFSDYNSSFLYNAEFPVFSFRTFQFLTNQEFSGSNQTIGDKLDFEDALINYNNLKDIPVRNTQYTFQNIGIYNIKEKNASPKMYAVNLKDFNESQYLPFKSRSNSSIMFLNKNWKSKILQSRLGIEIWKYLFVIVLLLIITEMIIIKKYEKHNK